jgi:hypothetical protein
LDDEHPISSRHAAAVRVRVRFLRMKQQYAMTGPAAKLGQFKGSVPGRDPIDAVHHEDGDGDLLGARSEAELVLQGGE